MSKRCKLQKEYYKEFGNYKGSGKYTDHYVKWLESKVLAINYTHCSTQLKDKEKPTFEEWLKDNFEYLNPKAVVSKDHICVWTMTEIKDIYNSLRI